MNTPFPWGTYTLADYAPYYSKRQARYRLTLAAICSLAGSVSASYRFGRE